MATAGDDGPAPEPRKPVAVGRRVLLGMAGLGAVGIVFGAKVQDALHDTLGPAFDAFFPGGDRFRYYTITGSYPQIAPSAYRLHVTGLVQRPLTLTLADLEAMPRTAFTKDFQCVTGWRVPNVHWEGVPLSHVLDTAGVRPGAVALTFESYDGADTESLTLEQARLPEVIVAVRMLGGRITREHGGPVRLYVAPMFGYKSLKWLSAIRVVDRVEPGYWERNGYPLNGWVDGNTGPVDA